MADLPIAGCRTIDLEVKGDERGSLIAVEQASGLPFAVARAYYIFGTQPGVARGFHAHHRLRQWLIAVSGACTVKLDDGKAVSEVRLDRPDLALEVGPMAWHEMEEFTPDCVLLALADAPYEEADYIRDREEFLTLAASA